MNRDLYVPHCEPAEEKARELAKNKLPLEAYKAITAYVKHTIAYDYVKATKVANMAQKSGILPDPQKCWETRLGICQDIASLTVIMLRAADLPARLVIGWAGKQYHAWVETVVGGKVYRFDHSAGLIKPRYKPVVYY